MQNSLSFEFWVIVFFVCVAILAAYYIFFFLKKREAKRVDNSYLLGLKYMAEGENRRAVEMFKDAVRHNSENIDAYIKLGVILRTEKLYNNAIRIHKDLLFRGTLAPDEGNDVQFHLAMDYLQSGNEAKSLEYLENLKDDKKYSAVILGHLLNLYTNQKLWDKAIELIKSRPYVKTEDGKKRLAAFKVEKGKEIAAAGNGKDARVIFKDALKNDPLNSDAYIMIGDSYLAENRATDAINSWTNICDKVPESSHLVFRRLEKAWYEKGQFIKIEELYTSLLEKNEEDIYAIINLAEIYRKKGDFKQALKILNNAPKKEFLVDKINFEIIKVLYDNGQYKESSKQAIMLGEEKFCLKD